MAYITLDSQAYHDNLTHLVDRLGAKEKLAVVLKDNAYGHGLMPMAKLASDYGISKAIVRNHQEASLIEALFPFIMILSPDMSQSSTRFSLVINSLEHLAKAPKQAKIHLKIDSGMHRNGISLAEIEAAFIMIQEKGLVLEGVMTHFRSADELSTELFWQMRVWKDIKAIVSGLVSKYAFEMPLFHSGNSATLLGLEHYHDDIVRCGIATYGYGDKNLKPVLSLWAEKITTRKLKKGEKIGYGGVGVMPENGSVSTYDVGYADGYFRYDGKGKLTTQEGFALLGRVSMDNLSIASDAQKVMLFSDARSLADYHDTIVYDILTRLSPLLKRQVL